MLKKLPTAKRHKGFTIVELVIVIAVIAILAAVLIPTFSSITESARYQSAYQQAVNQYKDESTRYMLQGVSTGAPNDTVYSVDGYYFKVKNGGLVQISDEEYAQLALVEIKNVIFLIPDGAGFGSYDIANLLKTTYGTGVSGQATPITTNAISGKTVTGLYLDEYMIASADTYQFHGAADGATDSTAAGTALLSGYKTNKLMSGVTNDARARANLLELCRLEGKATGFVTTKCLIDATPCSGTVHVLRRPDQKPSYQEDANKQYMVCGIDVLLAYGTDGGYYRDGSLIANPLKARDYGYTLVSNLSTLRSVVDSGAKKIFSNILDDCNGEYSGKAGTDYQANHIKYDCFASPGTDLTLMDMAKGALKALAENINDPDGFCLVIEGGAIDNACEGRNVKEGISDYLAFDEVFGYCVNWALARGDTIVIACPDHDSGGFYEDPNSTSAPKAANAAGKAYDTMEQVVAALADGSMANKTVLAGAVSGHSPQNVPVWLYAPERVRAAILQDLGLPADACAAKVRTGRYCDGSVIDPAYAINNSDIAPAVVRAMGLRSFDEATAALFCLINEDDTYGSYDPATQIFTFKNGETVPRNANYWVDASANKHYFTCGFSLYLTNEGDTYNIHCDPARAPGTYPNRFYVPRQALVEMGYAA